VTGFNWASNTRVLVCIISALFVHPLVRFVATVLLNGLGLRASEMKLGYGISPWTPEEEERLKSLISARLRPHEIAVKPHRTVQAVYTRAKKLRLSFKQQTKTFQR